MNIDNECSAQCSAGENNSLHLLRDIRADLGLKWIKISYLNS